ncbi:MAG: polyprenyl diphosphate synthase [Candidatus Nanoarchaeia archaeon]|nr:polyprenyl diphosphate synthase [Candidatus Nanoarchaeia archaeon]
MLNEIKDILKIRKKRVISNIPRHIAISIEKELRSTKNTSLDETYKKRRKIIKEIIELQIKLNIPIITFFILSKNSKKSEIFSFLMDEISGFFSELKNYRSIYKNQVKVSVVGKWYDLPERVVSEIKEVIESTKDYDRFFVNFCVNYDGHEEIIDACKLIARQVKSERLDPESINSEVIKENLYTSYFISPNLIIQNSDEFSGILLWDSKDSVIFFTRKQWNSFTKADFMKAIENFQNKN